MKTEKELAAFEEASLLIEKGYVDPSRLEEIYQKILAKKEASEDASEDR